MKWLKRHRKTALFEAVEKLKSVLILLGFMSLILAVTQRPISKICIPTNVAYTMLPCRKSGPTKTTKALGVLLPNFSSMKAFFEDLEPVERMLAGPDSSSTDHCESQGKTSFISQGGINQLNNFIFVLAIMQIVYSVLTMALGRAKKCFFRQFFNSVAKVDYLTLRHGFISAHLSTNHSFNFQKYIERSLEDDFKVVVGISPFMWLLVVIFILVDVHGWHVYLWVSFIPLLIVLVLGTKLEVIVARMALTLDEKNSVIIGSPLVQPSDNLFWFGHPKFVLSLLHLTLFMNAFELAFFVWVTWQFGISSCYHERTEIIVIRVVLAVTVQITCSYITLPLYALVTQMGSNFKRAVLEEHTVRAIRQWHSEVKQKRKKNHTSQSTHDYSSTTMDHSNATITSSPEHASSRHNRSPTFANQLSHFSTDTEIVEDHQENRRNELEEQPVRASLSSSG
ncbi:Mlo-related protein [Parasponia andersonii]|uniref:MLO-like protein n=1 Tax=Parasponia andersonii TaxID=3476 RepID=A0A2P5BYY3_PARAD|nr:Mlo-related protein [Parasponia andersonii]